MLCALVVVIILGGSPLQKHTEWIDCSQVGGVKTYDLAPDAEVQFRLALLTQEARHRWKAEIEPPELHDLPFDVRPIPGQILAMKSWRMKCGKF